MFQEGIKMSHQPKYSLDQSYQENRQKLSSVGSTYSRQSKNRTQSNHGDNNGEHRERRLNSLFKLRLDKLSQITEENKKIFLRLNQQQSHYNSNKTPSTSLDKSKKTQNLASTRLLGPIGNYQIPPCFMIGLRGIMCENNLGIDNIIHKHIEHKLPSIKSPSKNISKYIEKQNDKPINSSKNSQYNFFRVNKKTKLPSLYLFI